MSDALWYEYEDVLSRLLSSERWRRLQPVLNALILRAEFVTIYYTWRPASTDPGDEHVIDCAMNASAILVTSNLRDFREAEHWLGLRVIRPIELVTRLMESDFQKKEIKMSRLTLRLPDTLHQNLEVLARQEGVSLNQYIVYALTQQSTSASVLRKIPVKKIAEQRANYLSRLQQAQIATEEEIDQILAERESAEPEPELTAEIVDRVKKRIAVGRKSQNKQTIISS